MRIRKNSKILQLMLSSSDYPPEAIFQTTPHLCQLNQSPWDVLLPSNSTSSSYPALNHLEGSGNIFSENASIGDSLAAIESKNKDDNAALKITNTKEKKSKKSEPPQSKNVVRRRGRGPGKKKLTSNRHEFYYYSGFGPRWGKNRGEKDEEQSNVETVKGESRSSSSQLIEHDNEDDDDDDDSESDDNGRKRGRKPVKARSLKSLM